MKLSTSRSMNVFYLLPTILLVEDSTWLLEAWWLRWSVGLSWPRNERSPFHWLFTSLTHGEGETDDQFMSHLVEASDPATKTPFDLEEK